MFSDLNVRAVDRAEKKTTVQAELHVRSTGSLSTGSRDMLTDVRSRDQDFGKRDRIVGEEVELEVVLGVWVRVDLAGNIDDQADSLMKSQDQRFRLEKAERREDTPISRYSLEA